MCWHRRVFRTAALLVAVACLIGAAGCERSGEQSDKPQIALIMKSLANEFFSTMADGAERHQAENADKYDLIVNGLKNEGDLSRQRALVNEMVAQGVDAIVIAPADSTAMVTVLKLAQKEGIVVINIDNKLDEDVLKEAGVEIPFVGPDNRAGARKVGEHLAKQLKPGDCVGVLQGIPTAFNAQQRRLGFEDAMRAAEVQIVASQSGDWEMDKANRVTSAMISEHPEIKALLCSNDTMAIGSQTAVKAAGRSGEIQIVGFDNISAIQQLVKDGTVLATADQHADQLAVYGIEYALQIIQDQVTPDDKETPVDLITAESLK